MQRLEVLRQNMERLLPGPIPMEWGKSSSAAVATLISYQMWRRTFLYDVTCRTLLCRRERQSLARAKATKALLWRSLGLRRQAPMRRCARTSQDFVTHMLCTEDSRLLVRHSLALFTLLVRARAFTNSSFSRATRK